MRTKPMQLSIMAVAALAVFAVAAVMLLSGGNPAQADTAATIAPDSGGGHMSPLPQATTPTPTPRFPAEPPCPEHAAPVVDSGHIALFDVWWNTEELELTNTSCPPTVVHVPAGEDDDGNTTPAEDNRSPSSINIEETVIHIPNSAMDTLTEAKYPKAKYQKVWDADDAENPDGPGDKKVWVLPACPDSPATTTLCLDFSAALLNDADWNGNIVYHMDHVHQVDIDKQDARYVLAYDVTSESVQLHWSSYDARVSRMPVTPGGYERPMWFFTSRGSYEFQVHITGDPEQDDTVLGGLDPVSKDPSVNSDVRTYILHVGAEADLGVSASIQPALESGDTTLDPGDDVSIRIQATNQGPDAAPETKVKVTLPEGLNNIRKVSTLDDYDPCTGVWNVGNLASGGNDNLLLTATVAAGTRGQDITVKAEISATETLQIKEVVKNDQGEEEVTTVPYHVAVPDKVSGNNTAESKVTVASSANVDPMFSVARSVPENTPHQHPVGDPIPVLPGDNDLLTYTLTGNDASSFMVESVAAGAQIRVHGSADLDFETKASYQVVLNMSDGKNALGNADSEIDSSIAVPISITDVAETVRVAVSREKVGQTGTCTATVSNLPSADTVVRYSWTVFDLPTNSWAYVGHNSHTYSVTYDTPGTRKFQVHVTYTDANGKTHYIHSGFPALTWE